MKQDTNEFLHHLKPEIREIVDLVSGILFENISNVKENITNNKLKYSNASLGSICSIYIRDEKVILEFRVGKKFSFEKYNDVNKEKIKKFINT